MSQMGSPSWQSTGRIATSRARQDRRRNRHLRGRATRSPAVTAISLLWRRLNHDGWTCQVDRIQLFGGYQRETTHHTATLSAGAVMRRRLTCLREGGRPARHEPR